MAEKYKQLKANIEFYATGETGILSLTLKAAKSAIIELQEENANFITTIESQKEEIEKQIVRPSFPLQPNKEGGWTVSTDYLKSIQQAISSTDNNELPDAVPSWEQIEMVLLAIGNVVDFKAITELAVKGLERISVTFERGEMVRLAYEHLHKIKEIKSEQT